MVQAGSLRDGRMPVNREVNARDGRMPVNREVNARRGRMPVNREVNARPREKIPRAVAVRRLSKDNKFFLRRQIALAGH